MASKGINKQVLEQSKWLYKKMTKNNKYTQDWPNYNKAQTNEKLILYKLLKELLQIIPEEKYSFGRPKKSIRDMIFCCMIKIYSNTSSRRTISELELARRSGYIKEVPSFNTLLNYFKDERLSIILPYLIKISSLPLQHVEESFAVDSTGFGTGRFDRWVDVRTQTASKKKGWRKCHAICGVKTNIITSVEVTDGKAHDSPQFNPLVSNTFKNFNVKEVSADKAYCSRKNLELVSKLMAMPYIPFRKNMKKNSKGSLIWPVMFKIFTEDYAKFAQHYHKRSNIEACFAMIKRKFGDNVRCKTERSQDNEIRFKVLAHNIVCLIHEIFELKIDVNFSKVAKKLPAQEVMY